MRALIEGTEFSEPKPAKAWKEGWDQVKEKTKIKYQEVSEKTNELCHRADQRLLKSRTLGNLWRKIRKHEENVPECNCDVCIRRNAEKEAEALTKKRSKMGDNVDELIGLSDEEDQEVVVRNDEIPVEAEDEEDCFKVGDIELEKAVSAQMDATEVKAN